MNSVYKILCKTTGMYYIGATRQLRRRLNAHEAALRRKGHENAHLQRAWDKYGEDAFEFLPVASALRPELLDAVEQALIQEAMDAKVAYNMCVVAGPIQSGHRFTDAAKQNISRARTGKKLSPEALASRRAKVAGLPNPMQGRKQSEETKRLISERLKAGFKAGRAPTVGVCSEETKQRLSTRHKGTSWRLNKGKPVIGTKGGEVREWLTTIACAKDIGCDLSYPSQRVNTDKRVKGWKLVYK